MASVRRIGDVVITRTNAEFYDDGRRRLTLTREWGPNLLGNRLLGIGLNPSIAGVATNDATIRVMVGFAHRWGFDALDMVNMHDWVETDSKKLWQVAEKNGPRNNAVIEHLAARAAGIWCCWGNGDDNRAAFLIGLLWEHRAKMFCLGRTKKGQPRHPLRLSRATERVPMVAGL